MHFILEVIIEALVILLMARALPSVVIKNFGSAVAVALVLGLLNATIGWLLRIPFNLVTFFLLTFLVRLFVTAIMIKLVDKLFNSFEVKTFTAAFLLALALALAGTALDYIYYD